LVEKHEIEEIFSRTLVEDVEDETAWKAVNELRLVGTRKVFDFAVAQTQSLSWIARVRAVDIIAQIDNITGITHHFRAEAGKLIENLLRNESDLHVLNSCIIALGHYKYFEALDLICKFSSHPASEIRYAVAVALGAMPDEHGIVVSEQLQLMQDVDEDVRDWATFGLGVLSEVDTPVIRDALIQRLGDSHYDTRCEAMAGLAKRRDEHCLPLLLECLEDGNDGQLVTEAATNILELDSEPMEWTAEMFAVEVRKKFHIDPD
jgi:HEAT repeat protein